MSESPSMPSMTGRLVNAGGKRLRRAHFKALKGRPDITGITSPLTTEHQTPSLDAASLPPSPPIPSAPDSPSCSATSLNNVPHFADDDANRDFENANESCYATAETSVSKRESNPQFQHPHHAARKTDASDPASECNHRHARQRNYAKFHRSIHAQLRPPATCSASACVQ